MAVPGSSLASRPLWVNDEYTGGMGRFEIILVLIGIVWTVVSAIAQKKAKAAKMAALKAQDADTTLLVSDEDEEEEPAPAVQVELAEHEPRTRFEQLRERRLAQLRNRGGRVRASVAATGASVSPPPRKPTSPPRPPASEEAVEEAHAQQPEAVMARAHGVDIAAQHGREESIAGKLREALASKGKIREAILLNEILSKPLAIRSDS